MAKKKETEGDQLELIDVTPEYAKPIKALARKLKRDSQALSDARITVGEDKAKMIELIEKAGVAPDPATGVTTLRLDDMTIKVVPSDKKIKVKLDDDDDAEIDDDQD